MDNSESDEYHYHCPKCHEYSNYMNKDGKYECSDRHCRSRQAKKTNNCESCQSVEWNRLKTEEWKIQCQLAQLDKKPEPRMPSLITSFPCTCK